MNIAEIMNGCAAQQQRFRLKPGFGPGVPGKYGV